MYQANRSSFSRRGTNRDKSFSRPQFGGRFNQRRNRPSQLGKNPEIFIRKAVIDNEHLDFKPNHRFEELEINSALKQNIQSQGYTQPTPIQDQAIPAILEGRDLIGLANTGSGKTAAFLIPLIDKIYKNRNQKALIIVPTRELALQIQDELFKFSAGMKIYSSLVIGGANMNRQIHEIRRNPHVVIGTPGRLKDLIKQRVLHLDDFSNFVLDEVDLMVDIGFIADIKLFISLLPKERQSLFFSATIAPKVQEVLTSFVKNPVTVSIKQRSPQENIDQDIVRVINPVKKIDQLHDILISEGVDKVLIFGRTKHGIEKLDQELILRGFKTGAIHGNKTQGHRKRVLQSFRDDQIKILLATDVASRGLDIANVTHVINYELPETYEDYIHRIGRTGRANKKGTALTFID